MGYETHFYGKLEFTRQLCREELSTLDKIINAARHNSDEIFEAVNRQADATRAIERDGKGPLVIDPHQGANLRAGFQNLITGEDLSPHDAASLRISDDGSGLVYCSEKTYDMIAGVNFIIANGRERIPGFGLKGSLYASAEFEPYTWLVRINEQGWAEQASCGPDALWSHDKRAYLKRAKQHFYGKVMGPIWRARNRDYAMRQRNDDPRDGFRRAADSACCGICKLEDVYDRMRWRVRYGANWPERKTDRYGKMLWFLRHGAAWPDKRF